MSSPTMLQRLGTKAAGAASALKSLPPDSNEADSLKEKQSQVDAVSGHPATAAPAPEATPSEQDKVNPLARYGSKPGEKRLDTSYADQPSAIKVPVYDQGGDVGIIGGTNNNAQPSSGMKPIRMYDEGGEVNVDPEQHQLAVLKDGEKVLSPEQADQYRAEHPEHGAPAGFPGMVLPNDKGVQPKWDTEDTRPSDTDRLPTGVKANTDNAPLETPKGDTSNPPTAQLAKPGAMHEVSTDTGLKPYSQVMEDKAKAKAAEQVNNPNPTGQPSVASSTETQVQPGEGQAVPEEKPKLTYGHILADKWMQGNGMPSMASLSTPKEFNQGSPEQGAVEQGMTAPKGMNQGAAPSGLKPIVQPETAVAPVGKAAYQAKMKAYETAYMDAMHKAAQTNDPQYREQAGRIKEEQLTYQQQHPAGTPESAHPGILGKLGHVANGVAGRARNIGIDLGATPESEKVYGLAAKQAAAEGQVKEAAAQNVAENKADKTATGPEWKLNANVVGPNGRAVLENSKTGETKEAPEGYTAYDKPVHGGDQATYIDQWYKDNPDAPKSTANDDKAIGAYSAAKEASAQENKAKGQTRYYNTPEGRQAYTYAEAKAAGLNPVEAGSQVPAAQVEKDRKANDTYDGLKGQLTQYRENIAKSAGQLLPSDVESMSSVIESVESPDYVSKIVTGAIDDFYGKPVTGYNEKVMKGALTKSAYDKMSPAARQLVADYFTTLLAHFGNVKATLGQVPRNEKLITTEMNMIPKPYLNAAEAEPAFSNYTAQVERNNAHNVRFGTQKPEAAAPKAQQATTTPPQQSDEEKKLVQSINLPGGGHPVAAAKLPNGDTIIYDGVSEHWTNLTTGQPAK